MSCRNARLVYAYDMYWQGKKVSVTLASIEFVAARKGTRLIVIEQHAFLDGHEDGASRERGTQGLLENLDVALAGGDTRLPTKLSVACDYCGYSEPRYATTSIISLSVSFSTTGAICTAASLARVPLRNASICRSR